MINNPIAIDLGIYVSNIYNRPESRDTFLDTLVTGNIHRSILLTVYRMITKDGSVPYIESITTEEKTKYWDRAKKMAAGRMDNEKCIELSKALYTLELL